MNIAARYLRDFSHLAFPFNCFGCNKALDEGESPVCSECIDELPLTRYWDQEDNAVEKLFWGRIEIAQASSMFYFIKEGTVQTLIHQLKYNNKPQVGEILGRHFGGILKDSKYSDIDVIIPVPLHRSKLQKRKYNQCDQIAKGIAQSMGKSYNVNAVSRLKANETQTKKGRFERWINVKELFKVVEPKFVAGKHVMLVDDVVTTGSTLEACADAILQVPGTKLSAVTLACPSPY